MQVALQKIFKGSAKDWQRIYDSRAKNQRMPKNGAKKLEKQSGALCQKCPPGLVVAAPNLRSAWCRSLFRTSGTGTEPFSILNWSWRLSSAAYVPGFARCGRFKRSFAVFPTCSKRMAKAGMPKPEQSRSPGFGQEKVSTRLGQEWPWNQRASPGLYRAQRWRGAADEQRMGQLRLFLQ
jgi:hypothetical protein